MKVRNAENKYVVEKEYAGFRCLAHKMKGKVSLISAGRDTVNLDFFNNDIISMSDKDFLVDGVLVAYNGKLPLNKAAMMNIIENGKLPSSIIVKFHVFDMLYYDGIDISDFPLHKRKALLNQLEFNPSVKNVYSLIVTTKPDLEKSVRLFSSMPGSGGAIVKEYNSTYSLSEWLKFSKNQILNVAVLDLKQEGDSFTYTVGLPVSEVKYSLRPNQLLNFEGNPYLTLGQTGRTKTECKPGEIIKMQVDEVWRHEWYTNGDISFVKFTLHNPVLISMGETLSEIEQLEKLSLSRGRRIVENMELVLDDKLPEVEGGIISSFGLEFWGDNWARMYPKDGQGRFTLHQHWTQPGKVYGDLRFSATNDAWGFTVFEGNEIPEEGSNLLLKNKCKLQVHPKVRFPLDWLDYGKEEAHLTDNNEKFFALDWGSYSAGTWKDNMIELFLDGKGLTGRILINLVTVGEEKCWIISFAEDSKPYAKTHVKEDVLAEMKLGGMECLIWNDPSDLETAPEIIDLK